MSSIKRYETESAYTADKTSRNALHTTVASHIKNPANVHFDYCNKVVGMSQAAINDTVALNLVTKKPCIIKAHGSNGKPYIPVASANILDSNGNVLVAAGNPMLIPIGTIFIAEDGGRRVASAYVEESRRWGAGYKVKLSNFLTTAGSFNLTFNMIGTDVTGTINYPAGATMAAIIELIKAAGLNTALTFEGNETSRYITIEHNEYRGGSCSASGNVTLTALMLTKPQIQTTDAVFSALSRTDLSGKVKTYTACPLVGGGTSPVYAGANFEQFKAWATTGGMTPTENLATNHSGSSGIPVNKDSFDNSAYCDALRTAYGNYDTYLESRIGKFPADSGVLLDTDGKAASDAMGQLTYTDADGSTKPYFPSANYCYTYAPAGIPAWAAARFGAHNWHQGAAAEVYQFEKLSKVDGTDEYNTSITQMEGQRILPSSRHQQISTQCSSNNQWIFYYFCGSLHYWGTKRSSFFARPLLAFNLSEFDD